jgi:hypothetical protein
MNFWTSALQSGGVGRGDFVLRVLEGARATPPVDASDDFIAQQDADRAYLDDKIDIGLYVATQLGLSDVEAARDTMALYDGSKDSLAAALAAADQTREVATGLDGSGQFLVELIGVDDASSIV